jgi:hypothetical protein
MSFHRPAFVVATLHENVDAEDLTDRHKIFYLDGTQALRNTNSYPVVKCHTIGDGSTWTGLRCALEVPGKKNDKVSAQVMGLFRHGTWKDETWVKLDA